MHPLIRAFSRSIPLYLLTDTAAARLSHVKTVRRALEAGVRVVQMREKNLSRKYIYQDACSIRELTKKHNALFIMNDYVDIALAADADGVHLGQEDMPLKEARNILGNDKLIGISTHTLRQAVNAETEGADYIGFGPIYSTKTKDAGRPRGVRALKNIREHVNIPIVAIGGITWENVCEVLHSGADAVAVASGILSGTISVNVRKFSEALVNTI